jgi:hypothetical protein
MIWNIFTNVSIEPATSLFTGEELFYRRRHIPEFVFTAAESPDISRYFLSII